MNGPHPGLGHRPGFSADVDGAPGSDRAKLVIYQISFAISFGLYLVMHGWGRGSIFWLLTLLVVAGFTIGATARPFARHGWLLRVSIILAAGLAVAVPLGPLTVASGSLASSIANSLVWPQILVTLFASRVLAELSDLQFSAFWRNPYRAGWTVQVQSIAAAAALGTSMALLFYQSAWQFAGERLASSGIVIHALLGDTAIHYAIMLLFFVLLALLIDAARLHVRDRALLAAVRSAAAAHGGHTSAVDLRRLLLSDLAPWSQARSFHFILDALDPREAGRIKSVSSAALAGFHQAARRFIKGLVPFLPLLGFLGTVIGLSIALSELPHGLGVGQGQAQGPAFDIGGSLAGLAIKFETTLLGLVASLIVSLAIAVLEKAEAELAAECSLIVEASQEKRADAF